MSVAAATGMRIGRWLLAATLSVFGMACSSAEDVTADEPAAADRVVVDATSATRDAIGVASWGVTPGVASAVIHGYDDHHQRILTFDYRASNDGTSRFDASLDAGDEHAMLRVEAPDAEHVRVLDDSFAASAKAKTILARIEADLRSQPARFVGSQPGLATSSLHGLDAPLAQGGTSLTQGCAALASTAGADGAKTTSACSGGANAAACRQGIDETKAQSGDQQCTLECTGDERPIAENEVEITKVVNPGGKDAVRGYIGQALDALCIKDQAARDRWTNGYLTLTQRESSYDPNAVNTSDSNATGPRAADGNPHKCSRGLAQCIPSTFAAHHQPGTGTNVYDPVANIAASMNYVIAEYGVQRDGSNLSAKVQQADPGRGPGGY